MPFGAHETMEAHEILNEKMNLINHFSFYLDQCQDMQLKNMIDHHLRSAVESYDRLIAYTHDYSAATPGFQPARTAAQYTSGVRPQHIQYGLRNPAPVTPQFQPLFNDQQIASALLAFHKNSAKNHMNAALECADPNVRAMLLEGANTCAQQAYEVFLYMNSLGQYQVPTLHDQTAKTFLHRYQPVGQNQVNRGAGTTQNMQMPNMQTQNMQMPNMQMRNMRPPTQPPMANQPGMINQEIQQSFQHAPIQPIRQ